MSGGVGKSLVFFRPDDLESKYSQMPTAYLSVGSNQGDRARHLQAAVDRLHEQGKVRVTATSPVYETEAHTLTPGESQPAFLNAVIAVEVEASPEGLLQEVQAVERAEGRDRTEEQRWGPRPLDIDLLVVGTVTRRTDRLTLPHPRLAERRFVLRPWADLAPNLVVPLPFDRSVRALLDACPDASALARAPASLVVPPRTDPGSRRSDS